MTKPEWEPMTEEEEKALDIDLAFEDQAIYRRMLLDIINNRRLAFDIVELWLFKNDRLTIENREPGRENTHYWAKMDDFE